MRDLAFDPRWKGLLVSAPAGWGKTRLLDEVAGSCGLPVTRFQMGPASDAADRFREALEAAEGGALLIDDLHAAGGRLDGTIRDALEIGRVKLFAATRQESAPFWPLLAARGEVACLGPSDLALSAGEVAAAFQAESGDAVPGTWRDLLDEAAGWPLAVMALARAYAQGARRLGGVPDPPWPVLLDLVEGAIWHELDPGSRDVVRMAALLLKPRVQTLEHMGAGRREQADLLRRFSLVPGRMPGDVKLAPGLAVFVRDREPAGADTRRSWHLAAAAACERAEDWEAAIAHQLAAIAPEPARHEAPRRATPAAWLDALEAAGLSSEPLARLWRGRLDAQAGRSAEAERMFRAARDAFEAAADGAGVYACLVSAASAALARGDTAAFDRIVKEAESWEEAGLPEDQVQLLVAQGALGTDLPGADTAGELARVAAAMPPLGAREAHLARKLLLQTPQPSPAARRPAARPPGLTVRALGPLRVFLPDGREVQWPRRKAKILLAYLLVSPRGADRLTLAESLSGGAVGAGAEHALRVVVHALRKSLEHAPDGVQASRYVVFDQDRYRLTKGAVAESDVADLEKLLAQGDAQRASGDDAAAAQTYRAAAGAYTGDLFDEEVLLPYFEVERTGLRARVVEGLRLATEFHRERGDMPAAETAAKRMTEIHPTDEAAHRLLVELYLGQGRRDLARHQIQVYRLVCERILGYAPDSEEIEALLDGATL